MVGISGVIGSFNQKRSYLADQLHYFGDEFSKEYKQDDLFIAIVTHTEDEREMPVQIESTGELLWIWGEVYGHYDNFGSYVAKSDEAPSLTKSEYCAVLYEKYGEEFISGLNGSFAGVIFDEATHSLRLFTDRLGSRPIYYTLAEEGIVFSTQIQALSAFLSDRLSFDKNFTAEYFAFERTLGRKTPIAGVECIHPGAITRIDLNNHSVTVDVKWRPTHEPTSQPFNHFVDEFVKVFKSAVDERYDSNKKTGVLLSGGSDSRLIMSALPDKNVTGYHINDWKNREAEVAEQIADVLGKPFVFIERNEEYYRRALEFSARVSNYASWLQHGHASGFADVLRAESDVLITGHYSDTLFKSHYLPYRGISIPGTSLEIPMYTEETVETVADLVEMYLGTKFHNRKHDGTLPNYLQVDTDLRTILEKNIGMENGLVNHHGVTYASPYDAALFSEAYPLTNTAGRLFFDVMLQIAPYRNPFLDVRLIELMTKLPIEYRLRKNIINASISQTQPELADLPHPYRNIAIKHPFVLQYLAMYVNWVKNRLKSETKPQPYYNSQGSWPKWPELIRHQYLVKSALKEQIGVLEATEWIDMDVVWNEYERHMNGEDRFDQLYSAFSFASIPATQSLLQPDSV